MIIIGVDFHPEFQQIASVDTETGEVQEKRLGHREEAEAFYRALAGQKVRVGMEASGHGRWFERLLSELQFELWIGDAAEIRTKRVRKQKTDRQDEERDGLNREIRVDNILKNESREDVSRKLGARVGVTVVAKAIKKHNSRF
jgi:hypothetical protein